MVAIELILCIYRKDIESIVFSQELFHLIIRFNRTKCEFWLGIFAEKANRNSGKNGILFVLNGFMGFDIL